MLENENFNIYFHLLHCRGLNNIFHFESNSTNYGINGGFSTLNILVRVQTKWNRIESSFFEFTLSSPLRISRIGGERERENCFNGRTIKKLGEGSVMKRRRLDFYEGEEFLGGIFSQGEWIPLHISWISRFSLRGKGGERHV